MGSAESRRSLNRRLPSGADPSPLRPLHELEQLPRVATYVAHVRSVGAARWVRNAGWFAFAAALAASVFGVVFSETLEIRSAAAEVATAVFVAGLGIAVVPVTLLLVPRMGEATQRELHLTRWRELLPIAVALLSAAAGTVHFGAIDEQAAGYWLFFLLFALLSVFQLVWAMLVFVWPSPLLYVVGLIGNLATIGVWIDSRTAGFPLGPMAGKPEAIAFGDVISTLFEVLIVIGVVVLLAARARLLPRGPVAATAAFLLTLLLIAPTALALISSVGTKLLVPPAN